MPEVPAGVREGLNEELTQKGLAALVAELEHVDPATFSIIDRQNPARVIRALEVYRASGQPISSFRKGRQPLEKPYRTLIIGLEDTREVLYQRIDRRVEEMLAAGLENEVLGLLEQGYSAEAPGMRSIGYQEWFPFINGVYDRAEVLRLIQRNSRRYAKRQFTFFRRFPEIRWFTAGDEEQIINWLETEMASSHS
ncbi:MAG: tRNA dimethylallyltransferase, partial [Bacteroidota bacterium]